MIHGEITTLWLKTSYWMEDGNNTSMNKITSIDVTGCPQLKNLDVSFNPVGKLDLSGNPKLECLYANDCQLSSLDLSANPLLKELQLKKNKLSSLDLSGNKELEVVWVHENQLTSLDVSNNPLLKKISCSSNQLSSLDLSVNKELETLWIYENHLTSLDLSANSKLEEVDVSENQLTDLKLAKFRPKLKWLAIYGNRFSEAAMMDVIAALPEQKRTAGELYVVDTKSPNEQNVCTPSAVAMAKAKNWKVFDANGDEPVEYEGGTHIEEVEATAAVEAIYDARGCRVSELQPGLNLVKYTDGTVRKVMK